MMIIQVIIMYDQRREIQHHHSIDERKRTKNKRGMGDGSRLVLCYV